MRERERERERELGEKKEKKLITKINMPCILISIYMRIYHFSQRKC